MPPAPEAAPQPAMPPAVPHTSHVPLWLSLGAVVLIALGALAYAFMPSAKKAEPKKIGVLSFRQFNDVAQGFKTEMTRLGYADAAYLDRLAVPGPTMMDDINAHVRELVAADVDAIWASLEMQAKTAIDVTRELGRTDIPVVFMTRFHDPVEFGLIQSFSSSGNNATGVATDLREIVQRNLQFFKDINPNFKKLGVFSEGFIVTAIGGEYYKALVAEAPRFGIELVEYKTSVPPPQAEAEFNRIAATIKKGDIDGVFHIAGHFYGTQEKGEGELAIRLGIPMVAPYEDLPNGGLFSYSDDFGSSGVATAEIMDRIFKGAAPSQIPVEYGANNVLTLMLGRARQGGVVFPDSMMFLAKNKFEDDSAFEVDSLNH